MFYYVYGYVYNREFSSTSMVILPNVAELATNTTATNYSSNLQFVHVHGEGTSNFCQVHHKISCIGCWEYMTENLKLRRLHLESNREFDHWQLLLLPWLPFHCAVRRTIPARDETSISKGSYVYLRLLEIYF